METINEKLMKDVIMIKRTNAILDYFKLIYIENIAYKIGETGAFAFKEFGGCNLLNAVNFNSDEGILDGNLTNYDVVLAFQECINYITQINVSVDMVTLNRVRNIGWLYQIDDDLDAEATISETMVAHTHYGTYGEVRKNFKNEPKEEDKKMLKVLSEIITSVNEKEKN